MTKTELFKFFHDLAIVPVVKIDDAAKAVPLAKAMIKGGINTAEITFRTDAAEEAIRRISEACPEMVVGAGTVINPSLAEKAVKAGAQFIVSAGLNPETVRWCNEHDVPCCPGVCTPSEIEMGLSLGLDTLKFFPAETSGGVKMLKDLGGPFPKLKFMTTGGINPANVQDYARTPNVMAIGGSWMVKADLIENEKWDEITRLCEEALRLVQCMELVHVGINTADAAEAKKVADTFTAFGMTLNDEGPPCIQVPGPRENGQLPGQEGLHGQGREREVRRQGQDEGLLLQRGSRRFRHPSREGLIAITHRFTRAAGDCRPFHVRRRDHTRGQAA